MTLRRAAIVLAGALLLLTAPAGAGQPSESAEPAAKGQELYTTGCSSCHGLDAEGTRRGPSLRGAGAASVDFYLSTGRMPLKTSGARQAVRKPPAYDRQEIDAIVAYVTSLDDRGPAIPDINVGKADLVEGGTLFRSNCAACHGAAGIGGALAKGRKAPALRPANPVEIAEAIRIGPGFMPNFGPETFTDEQVENIAAYVEHLDHAEDPGGGSLGRVGPIPEGFVGWLVGLGLLLAAAYWIGERE